MPVRGLNVVSVALNLSTFSVVTCSFDQQYKLRKNSLSPVDNIPKVRVKNSTLASFSNALFDLLLPVIIIA